MDMEVGLEEQLAAVLKDAIPVPDTDPLYGQLVEERARRRTRSQRVAIPAGLVIMGCLATGGYLLADSHNRVTLPYDAQASLGTHPSSSGGGMAPGCAGAHLASNGAGGDRRIVAHLGQVVTVGAHLEGASSVRVGAEQLVVMPPGYQPAAPGDADKPALRLAASNRLTGVRPAGQRVVLSWTPTAVGRYPLIDVASGVCDPTQGRYWGEGGFGFIIVRP